MPIDDDLDKLLWGCAAIGEAIGRTERQTYHLIITDQIPAKKIGKVWVSTLRRLRTHICDETAA